MSTLLFSKLILLTSIIASVFCSNSNINGKILRQHTMEVRNGQPLKVTYISMKKFENKILQVVPISGSLVPNSFECRKTCALTVDCIALNLIPVDPTTFRCHLLDKDHYLRTYLLIDSQDSEYHVISVSTLESRAFDYR